MLAYAHGVPAEHDDRSAGFHRRLGFGTRPAVLIVDMCQAYFTPGSPLDLGDRTSIDGCIELVSAARESRLPVWWSRVEFEPGGDGGVFYRKVGALKHFDRGDPLGNWLDELQPQSGEPVVTKQSASAFFGTDLAADLKADNIDTLVIGGVSTSGCVRATAIDACQHGIVPIVVREACGDRRAVVHEANLGDLDAKYADVESIDVVVDQLRRHQ